MVKPLGVSHTIPRACYNTEVLGKTSITLIWTNNNDFRTGAISPGHTRILSYLSIKLKRCYIIYCARFDSRKRII